MCIKSQLDDISNKMAQSYYNEIRCYLMDLR